MLTISAVLLLVTLLKLQVSGHESRDLAAFYAIVFFILLVMFSGRSLTSKLLEVVVAFGVVWAYFAVLDRLTDLALKPFYWPVLVGGLAALVTFRLYLDIQVFHELP